jgi:hypothetical protein
MNSVISVNEFTLCHQNSNYEARFEVITVVLLKMQQPWDVTPCRLVIVSDVTSQNLEFSRNSALERRRVHSWLEEQDFVRSYMNSQST